MDLSNSSNESPAKQVSTNPFDDSSDDDTFFYQECNEEEDEQQEDDEQQEQESLFSDITNATPFNTGAVDEINSQTTISITTQRSKIGKRVAPLCFDVQDVVAKPALDFSASQKSSHDFISPLETAMINRVDHLKSNGNISDDNTDEEEESDKDDAKSDDVKNDSYFSRLREFSTYFVSPSKQTSKKMKTHDKTDDIKKNEPPAGNRSRSIREKPILSQISTAFEDDVIGDKLLSPLDEAQDVLERLDAIEISLKKSKKKNRKKTLKNTKKAEEDKKVLKKIVSNNDHMTTDLRHAGGPWNRLIILEELGTASTWIVLLLPYIAFIFAVLLDTRADLWESTSGMMSSSQLCDTPGGHGPHEPIVFPISPLPKESCSYKYELIEGQGLLSHVRQNIDVVNFQYKKMMKEGVAFTSGPLEVPVLSSFLYGDIMYSSLSSSSVSLVADGTVQFSTIVLQQQLDSPLSEGKWFPVSISKPQQLSMLCEKEVDSYTQGSTIKWICKSPKNVEVLFALPETSVLTGGNLRVDTILTHSSDNSNTTAGGIRSKIISNRVEDKDALEEADRSRPDELLIEIARSVSYQFTCPSKFRTFILMIVRTGCLMLTFIFTCFWFWSMGLNGFFLIGHCFQRISTSEEEMMLNRKKKEVVWWECPWTLFPERRYLLFLLLFLILLQNPVLPYMHFYPELYSSTKMRVLADSLIGIGLHGVFFMWLCLFQGIRYHTGSNARKRAVHQKEILELRKVTQMLSSTGHSQYSSLGSPSDHLASYFEEFGDLHGTTAINIRLKHDLCGDGCADFLLPKLLLFIIGACAVVVMSLFRFSGTDMLDGILNAFSIAGHREVFIGSSLTQLGVLTVWAILIVRAALKSGASLRKEPFLSTRPAQLAYRVLMSILVLGIASCLLPLAYDIILLLDDWSTNQKAWHLSAFDDTGDELVYKTSSEYYVNNKIHSLADVVTTIILQAAQRFPYSGTAASLGPGEIIYVTTATLVVAFIFLPSTSYILDEDNQNTNEDHGDITAMKENQRRDKRAVLPMSRYTHTWRAFPTPIERHLNVKNTKLKVVESYQIDKHMKKINNSEMGRGTIYKRNYTPLFCVETALWLAECSWQTYYSTTEYKTDDFAPGVMNLDTLGLGLEADIFNEKTDTRAFVASNIADQVDGERDSIIVVAFRGTASSTNLKTDFNFGQEKLPDHFIDGAGNQPEFQINVTNAHNKDIEMTGETIANLTHRENNTTKGLIDEADLILRSAPLTRLAFPCVHSGFIQAYSLIRDEIIEKVIEVMERQINKALKRCGTNSEALVLPKIYVTGHSLGGSLAQLLSLDISCNVEIKLGTSSKHNGPARPHDNSAPDVHINDSADSDTPLPTFRQKAFVSRRHSLASPHGGYDSIKHDDNSSNFIHGILTGIDFAGEEQGNFMSVRPPIAVYTFGQPRVGNHSFSRFYKAHVPHTFRVVTEADAVTALPLPTSCPPALYKHAGLEVILDDGNTGNILVGPTIAETLFRFSKVRTSIYAHLMEKYRSGLESAFTQDEMQEFYHTHGVNSRSIRSGYNTSDLLPDWVTSISRRNF